MKKLLVAVVMLAVASSAMAGVLQVGQTAAAVEPGAITATVGGSFNLADPGGGINLGARCTMGAIESLLVAVDVGYMLPDDVMGFDMDNVIGLAVAGQYTLPVDLPVDLAIRLDYTVWDMEFKDAATISGLVLASAPIESVDGLALYGGVGYAYPLADGADGELIFSVGGTYNLPVENLSMYAEVSYMNDATIGGGVVWAFGGGE